METQAAEGEGRLSGALGGSGKLPRTYSWPERPKAVVRSRKQVRTGCRGWQ